VFVCLVLTLLALIACARVARDARRARRSGQSKPHLNLLAVAFGLIGLALPVHAYGQLTMFYFMIDEECPARGAGAFIDFQERLLPVSGVLECSDRTIQLVPSWVNPTLSMLLGLAFAAAFTAFVLWQRSRPLRPQQYVQGGQKALHENTMSEQGQLTNSLRWEAVSDFFDADLMGTLPEVVVPGTSVDDWQSLLNLVVERGWEHLYSEGSKVLPVPRAETILARPLDAECAELRVWPTADLLAIFRFHSPEVIDFDVDLRELQGQQRLDLFCGFLTTIGRRLGKPVLMDAEGGDGSHPVLGYKVETDQVVVMASPFVRLRNKRLQTVSPGGSSPIGRKSAA
jgi:hypothetical protein